MSLSSEQVEKVAKLARLRLENEQIAGYAHELSRILEMVDKLEAARTEDVEPMAHPLDLDARLRADVVTESDQREDFQALAPAVEGGLYLVPRVIE